MPEEDQSFTGHLENDPLGALFNQEPAAEETGAEPEETPEEVTPTPEAEETGKEPEKEPEKEVVPTKEPEKNEDEGFKQAYFAEKRKRQALEDQMRQATQPEPEKKPEWDWQNPEASISQVKDEVRAEAQAMLLNMSEAQAMNRHSDYEDKKAVFFKMAEQNPAYKATVLNSVDPAEELYKIATQQIALNEMGNDPNAYREKLKAELRAEIEAEQKNKATEREEIAKKLPPSAAKMTDKVPIGTKSGDPWKTIFPGQVAS